MREIPASILLLTSILSVVPPAFGHGGTYRGPTDTVPPGGGLPPSTTGSGAGMPGGPAGPSTGNPGGPMGLGGVNSGGNSGGQNGGANTGGSKVGLPDLSLWSFWWEYNKAPYLNLKASVFRGGPITGSEDDGLFGERNGKQSSLRPSEQQIRSKAVPALLKAIEEETHNDIVSGCLIALAKIGGDPAFLDVFRKQLASPTQEVAETAALSIGILGLPQGRSTLEQLAADNSEGRKLVGGKEVPFRTRTFAVYGLGLIGQAVGDANVRAACAVALRELLASDRSSYKDIRVACVLALGLIPDEGALSIEALRLLLKDKKTDKILRAHCPRSLAQLAEKSHPLRAAVVDDFLRLLEEKKEKDFVRQSAVYALGRMIRPGEDRFEDAVKAVESIALDAIDEQERHFALMSLGHMGGEEAKTFLLKQLQKPRAAGMRTWAALALGALGHAASQASAESNEIVVRALQSRFSEERTPEALGAYAIALGMLRDATSSSLLSGALHASKNDEVQGYLCLALGMIGARGSAEEIRQLVKEAKNKPQLLYQGTVALGLLGQKDMLPDLLGMLRGSRGLAARAAVVSALGFIGDSRSIDPLVENLGNKKLQPIERGFSGSALGLVCDKEMLPWNSRISTDLNYRAAVTTLSEPGGATGIVDLL